LKRTPPALGIRFLAQRPTDDPSNDRFLCFLLLTRFFLIVKNRIEEAIGSCNIDSIGYLGMLENRRGGK
jgi:ATP adenylyltransferase/5',5'''-P-1,P-4-tetraphosphate phosphorylase II